MNKYQILNEGKNVDLSEDALFHVSESKLIITCHEKVKNISFHNVANSTIDIIVSNEVQISFITTDINTKNIINIKCINDYSSVKIREVVLTSHSNSYKNIITISHLAKNVKSSYDFFGFATNQSMINIISKTYVPKLMEFADVKQNLKLINSGEACVEGVPILCIDEFNAKAVHSNSIGQMNEREIFFLMSKGVTETDAKWMILKGHISKVLNGFEDKEKIINNFREQYSEVEHE